jgi:hypothetical protein
MCARSTRVTVEKAIIAVAHCWHYFSPLNTFMKKGKDPVPDPYLREVQKHEDFQHCLEEWMISGNYA